MKKSNFQFARPMVKSIEYKMLEGFDRGEKTTFSNHFESHISYVQGKNEAVVELDIIVGNEEKSVNVPFTLRMLIGAQFWWDDDIEKEMVDNLLKMNAVSILLSYARPIISNITINSAIPYDLPFMDLTQIVNDEGQYKD